jgi:hypothetical protein
MQKYAIEKSAEWHSIFTSQIHQNSRLSNYRRKGKHTEVVHQKNKLRPFFRCFFFSFAFSLRVPLLKLSAEKSYSFEGQFAKTKINFWSSIASSGIKGTHCKRNEEDDLNLCRRENDHSLTSYRQLADNLSWKWSRDTHAIRFKIC